MEHYRITIRNPDLEMVELLRETASRNAMTLGECFNDAISTWYDSLSKTGLEFDTSSFARDYSG